MIKNIFAVFIFIFILIVGGFFYLQNQMNFSHGDFSGEKDFTIEKGADAMEIGENLESEGLISNSKLFVFYLWKHNLRGKIIAGDYVISSNLTIADIAVLITTKKEDNQIKITIPEGWRNLKIAERLKSNKLPVDEFETLSKDPKYFQGKYGYDFLNDIPNGYDLEGYLFPDTYFFTKDASAEMIIKKMLDNFERKVLADMILEIKSQGKSLYEIISMASVIEGEVRSQDDRKLVSGIFWNRIKSGQPLQSCATLAYVLGENKKQYSYADTQVDSPFNTYQNPGLPPGPISNPGISAIEAAIYPVETTYNYFLSNPQTGETVFSRTLDEHNTNKVKNGL
ncbi:MAG: Aminodeoxychorismate lyase [Candidatus Moranbacteria bacterium GW2011_GWE2_35_2-]|nr:MAG: Aminodeoxychorismate lyase [Candidatus Moranbacteria bacterium GW2011_GWE2_35_2-]KKQ29415.1 MAG: Aminodeoxychorismate lyase [Candidatus Moranbacteria bacterium GW2011_GWD1_37_17]KKQ30716.1 MAG: Aminodeoxychorismate lyase [Candidatus Moranbacteria bacterium GW2011_GWE1_37_24]